MSARENKYIIISGPEGLELPIIIPSMLDHDSVIKSGINVISAGFCFIEPEGTIFDVWCFGKSTTLNVSSRGDEDAKLIQFLLKRSAV